MTAKIIYLVKEELTGRMVDARSLECNWSQCPHCHHKTAEHIEGNTYMCWQCAYTFGGKKP